MTFGALKFRDSMKFNDAGLAKMIDSQRKVKEKLSDCFPILARFHPFVKNLEGDELEDALDLILRKVPFPYTSLRAKSSLTSHPSSTRAPMTTAWAASRAPTRCTL